jgi:hypothetical protein
MFSPIDRCGTRASSWWMMTMPISSESFEGLEVAHVAFVGDLAVIGAGGINTGKNFHQGRFAGPVFSHQSMDFTLPNLEVDILAALSRPGTSW